MKKLILTVGLPRSGKTTWAMKQGFPVLNIDEVRWQVYGHRFWGPGEELTWTIARIMFRALAAVNEVIIIDACNVTKKRREDWIKLVPEGTQIELEPFMASPKLCIDRARVTGDLEIIPVIERMALEFDLQKPEEWSL
jgi:predicted kinase